MRNLLAFIALSMLLWGQKKQKENEPAKSQGPKIDSLAIRIYQQAARYNDPIVKIYALHHRIAAEGASFGLLDTLAQAYFEAGFYRQAIAVVDEILLQQPRNATLAEIKALSYYYLQDIKKAVDAYEKLYEITSDPLHLYQVITLQFNLQRYGECQANIDKLLSLPESAQVQVRITTPEGQTQEIPLRAAAYNVRGVIFRLQKEYAKAKEAFEKALQIAPDFLLAKGNLDDMQKEISPPNPNKKN
jgi:tetratricopeptide (TPR) repeat protein